MLEEFSARTVEPRRRRHGPRLADRRGHHRQGGHRREAVQRREQQRHLRRRRRRPLLRPARRRPGDARRGRGAPGRAEGDLRRPAAGLHAPAPATCSATSSSGASATPTAPTDCANGRCDAAHRGPSGPAAEHQPRDRAREPGRGGLGRDGLRARRAVGPARLGRRPGGHGPPARARPRRPAAPGAPGAGERTELPSPIVLVFEEDADRTTRSCGCSARRRPPPSSSRRRSRPAASSSRRRGRRSGCRRRRTHRITRPRRARQIRPPLP